jgi:alpha-amylase
MPQLCFYFQLHQPYRLGNYDLFEIGNSLSYFDHFSNLNLEVFEKVSQKSYRPMLNLLNKLIATVPNFKVALSMSGLFLEQALAYDPIIIELIEKLTKSDRVELLAETYYHSLASLYDTSEFSEQVMLHSEILKQLFNYTPTVFRNTELIYSDDVADQVSTLGFSGMLTEAVPRYLHRRDRTQLFVDYSGRLPLLLKHAPLSDDLAFRFSDKNWASYPLLSETYLDWLSVYPENAIVNLFMDFETFGEHQWHDTGIFSFFEKMVTDFCGVDWNRTLLPYQIFSQEKQNQTDKWLKNNPQASAFIKKKIISQGPPVWDLPRYEVTSPISWADVDRDITAWVENPLQQDSIRLIYSLKDKVMATKNKDLIHIWRQLQTSDHFYYMCTKWSADGDVHAYFSPYQDPYEAYRRYSVVLADFETRIQ